VTSPTSGSARRAFRRPPRPERHGRIRVDSPGREPEGQTAPRRLAAQPSLERRTLATEQAARERLCRPVAHHLVEVTQHEQEAGDLERPETADLAQRARGRAGIEVTQRLEIAPPGSDLA